MSIFRRRSAAEPIVEDVATDAIEEVTSASDPQEVEPTSDEPVDRSEGPFDASEVDGLGDRLDLGALWLSSVPGAELRLEVDQASETVSALQIVIGDSAAQVQAFAAPRSGGVWREVREAIAAAITAGGGTVTPAAGAFGPELHVRMPQVGPDGRTVFAPALFVGVDGPRWFVRAVLSGSAAIDDAAGATLTQALRSIVVNRGAAPMAPREMLVMKLPEVSEQPAAPDADTAADDAGGDAAGDHEPAVSQDPHERYGDPDLDPFQRGPEITEVR